MHTAVAAVEHFGGVDTVANNAGAIAAGQPAAKKFDRMTDTNVRGTLPLTKASLPYRRKSADAPAITLAPPLNMHPPLVEPPPPDPLSKYGMRLISLGSAAEFADAGVGFSCIWPETYIATSAVANAFVDKS